MSFRSKERLLKLLPRRSPRLLAKSQSTSDISSSMVDLGLKGAKELHKSRSMVRPGHSFRPVIMKKQKAKQKEEANKTKSLKRMRESAVSLRSIENVMPTPMKRIKSSTSQKDIALKAIDAIKEHPPKKRFSARVATFAKGLSPSNSFRRKRYQDSKLPASRSFDNNENDKIEKITVKKSSEVQRSTSLRLPRNQTAANNVFYQSQRKQRKTSCVTPARRRGSKLWVDSFEYDESDGWTPQQIKRQEAIYELYCGETDMVEDLKLLQEVYFNPVAKLKLLTEEDLASIFGNIQVLLPLHEDLVKRLEEVRTENGSIEEIGRILTEWIPTLRPYIPYCANQLQMKNMLLHKTKENKHFSDFLQRCLESPFSRKLDLWSFLDSPRSKLVKYPLLISNMHKYTPKEHPDNIILYQAIQELEVIIKEADKATGKSKSSFYKDRMYFLDEGDHREALSQAQVLLCHGSLKNKNGGKIEAFLFDTVFLITRPASRNGMEMYQVLSQPLLTNDMEYANVSDGELRLGGSFRSSLTKGPTAKFAFRVNPKELTRGKSIILQANDQHDKKQWLNALSKVASMPSKGDPS